MLHIVNKIIEIKMFVSPLFAKTWLGCFEGYLFCDLCISGIPGHLMKAGLGAEYLPVLNSSLPVLHAPRNVPWRLFPKATLKWPYMLCCHSTERLSYHDRLSLWLSIYTSLLFFEGQKSLSCFSLSALSKHRAQQWLLGLPSSQVPDPLR